MRQVALTLSPVIPDLSITIHGAGIEAIPDDPVPAKVPDCALVLEADRHGHREPIVNFSAPEDATKLVDDNVVHLQRGHVGLDVVHRAGQNNKAFSPALVIEGIHDCGGVILATGSRMHKTETAALSLGLTSPICLVVCLRRRRLCLSMLKRIGKRQGGWQ